MEKPHEDHIDEQVASQITLQAGSHKQSLHAVNHARDLQVISLLSQTSTYALLQGQPHLSCASLLED